jgi:tRNA1(Val) A37 N6-methylase TrmN6
MSDSTTDTFFKGRLRVKQQRRGYRFSIDAVLLADHVRPRPEERLLDLGTGCGIIPLILVYRYPQLRIHGIEIQEELVRLAVSNIKENGMADRISILHEDLKALDVDKVGGPVDLVVSNPPYRKCDSGRLNPDPQRAVARHEIASTLFDVVEAARRLLNPSGRFVSIYTSDRLADVVWQLRSSGIEPKVLRTVHSKAQSDAKMILVEGVKGGRPGMIMMKPLIIYREDGAYTDEVERMFMP